MHEAPSTLLYIASIFIKLSNWYQSAFNAYTTPTSIGNNIDIQHNLCRTAFNTTASCQSTSLDAMLSLIKPNYTFIRFNKPETFLRSISMPSPPKPTAFGMNVQEYFDIEGIPIVLIHRSPTATKRKLFSKGVIIHIHGGGYVIGSFKETQDSKYMAYLHLFTALPVLSIDYRLAPQYPLQSGALLEDADEVIMNYLHHHLSVDFNKMYLTGCSAGGGAAIIMMHHFAKKSKYFGGVIPVSPWADIEASPRHGSYDKNGALDSLIGSDAMEMFKVYALGCRDVNGKKVAHDMDECVDNGLKELREREMDIMSQDWSIWSEESKSKIMFVASEYEILRDDAIAAHQKALNHALESELMLLQSRTHCLPVIGMIATVPEALESISRIARFILDANES